MTRDSSFYFVLSGAWAVVIAMVAFMAVMELIGRTQKPQPAPVHSQARLCEKADGTLLRVGWSEQAGDLYLCVSHGMLVGY